jgi:hypothetical protein
MFAPRGTEGEPAIDRQLPAQGFQIADQVCGRVIPKSRWIVAGVRETASASTLVHEHVAVAIRVEELSPPWRRAGAGPAVQDDGGLALRIVASLPVHVMPIAVSIRPES